MNDKQTRSESQNKLDYFYNMNAMNKNVSNMKQSFYVTLMSAVMTGVAVLSMSTLVNAETAAVKISQQELSAAKRLNSLLAKTSSLKATFVQTTSTAKSGKSQPKKPKQLQSSGLNKNFSGEMMVARPDRFRWETKQPAEQLIVANKDSLWIYDPDLEQATKQMVDKQVANTPALLLSGSPEKIMANFRVTQPKSAKDVFVLYPKTEDAVFQTLAVAFIDGKPRSMVLNDALGQVTTIKFTKVMQNPKLKGAVFEFQPPKGVDVIYQ